MVRIDEGEGVVRQRDCRRASKRSWIERNEDTIRTARHSEHRCCQGLGCKPGHNRAPSTSVTGRPRAPTTPQPASQGGSSMWDDRRITLLERSASEKACCHDRSPDWRIRCAVPQPESLLLLYLTACQACSHQDHLLPASHQSPSSTSDVAKTTEAKADYRLRVAGCSRSWNDRTVICP